MANGYCPPFLDTLTQLAKENDPQTKITPPGYTGLLLENNPSLQVVSGLTTTTPQGHKKTITFKYQPRYSDSVVNDEKSCDGGITPQYLEGTIQNPMEVSANIYIEDAEIAKFCEDASRTVSIGRPATSVMVEHTRSVARLANALISRMDQRLLEATVFGVNPSTGLSTAKVVNINADKNVNKLTDGVVDILQDASVAEIYGELLMAGSGNMNRYELQNIAATAASNGIDVSRFTGYRWYNDNKAATATGWGSNIIGVFEKGSIGLVDGNIYTGFRAGKKGNSEFFQFALPVNIGNGRTVDVVFDAQLKYYDCRFEDVDGYGQPVTYEPGYKLIISKTFGLFQWPTTVFGSGDVLEGYNGAMKYEITNTCVDCQA